MLLVDDRIFFENNKKQSRVKPGAERINIKRRTSSSKNIKASHDA